MVNPEQHEQRDTPPPSDEAALARPDLATDQAELLAYVDQSQEGPSNILRDAKTMQDIADMPSTDLHEAVRGLSKGKIIPKEYASSLQLGLTALLDRGQDVSAYFVGNNLSRLLPDVFERMGTAQRESVEATFPQLPLDQQLQRIDDPQFRATFPEFFKRTVEALAARMTENRKLELMVFTKDWMPDHIALFDKPLTQVAQSQDAVQVLQVGERVPTLLASSVMLKAIKSAVLRMAEFNGNPKLDYSPNALLRHVEAVRAHMAPDSVGASALNTLIKEKHLKEAAEAEVHDAIVAAFPDFFKPAYQPRIQKGRVAFLIEGEVHAFTYEVSFGNERRSEFEVLFKDTDGELMRAEAMNDRLNDLLS